jgi:glyoxylate reductase
MKKLLVAYQIPYEGIKKLEKYFEIIYPTKSFFTKDEIIAKISDCDALLSIFSMPVDKDIMLAANNLRLISNYGVGYNNIDIEAANERNISVCNTPEAVCRPTAELTLGLILSLSRRIAECNHRLRTEEDFKWGVMLNLGSGLHGKTLGVIGMGKIGLAVSKLAQAFGMKIIYNKRNRLDKVQESSLNIEYRSFKELLSSSDIITLHTPLNEQTHHLIGLKELNQMKDSALLINTARGSVVKEKDLVCALNNNIIKGAALDVFEDEPNINPGLKLFKNVIIVPHIGTASIDARIEMGKEAGENIINFFNESPTNIVN